MKWQRIHEQALMGTLGILALLILAGVSLARNPELSQIREELGQFREKISPVLLDEVAYRKARPVADREIPVIVKVKKDYFEEDLKNRRQLGRSQRNMLEGIHSYTARLTAWQIQALVQSDRVEYITVDIPIRAVVGWMTENRSASDENADQADWSGFWGDGVFWTERSLPV